MKHRSTETIKVPRKALAKLYWAARYRHGQLLKEPKASKEERQLFLALNKIEKAAGAKGLRL